jgi:hypothetical protein
VKKLAASSLILLLLLVPAAGASAGEGPTRLEAAYKKKGAYSDGFFPLVVDSGFTPAFVRIKNLTNAKQRVKLTDERVGFTSDYKVRWFDGKQKITGDVEGDGYRFKLPPRKERGRATFKIEVKALEPNPGPLCETANFFLPTIGYMASFPIYVNSDTEDCG